MTTDRTEAAAAQDFENFLGRTYSWAEASNFDQNTWLERFDAALAAADAADRDNSIARIRLDDELAEKIAQAIHDDECSGIHDANDCWTECPEWERDIYRRNARAVLDLLRNEAL